MADVQELLKARADAQADIAKAKARIAEIDAEVVELRKLMDGIRPRRAVKTVAATVEGDIGGQHE